MRRSRLWSPGLLVMLLTSPDLLFAQVDPAPIVQASNEFALDLYGRLVGSEAGNMIVSPSSIHTALAMTFLGARAETATEMGTVLRLSMNETAFLDQYDSLLSGLNGTTQGEALVIDPKPTREGIPAYELHMVNALWVQKGLGLDPGYRTSVEKRFHAGLDELDFGGDPEGSRQTINQWVETQTNARIRGLLSPGTIRRATGIVLSNAVYFKSDWARKFRKEATKERPFYRLNADSVLVPQMNDRHGYGYADLGDLQVLSLPYNGDALDMVVLLPRDRNGLSALEARLNPENLEGWLTSLEVEPVEVTLPRWKLDSGSLRLSTPLQSMGMVRAFSGADFTGMVSAPGLSIAEVIHRAFIEVDEDGTEAAAATAVVMAWGGIKNGFHEAKSFKADHPFVFLIRHRASGAILFLGRLTNPES